MDAVHPSRPGHSTVAIADIEANLPPSPQAHRLADKFAGSVPTPQSIWHPLDVSAAQRSAALQFQADHTAQQVKIVLGNTVIGATAGLFLVTAGASFNSPCRVIACATLRMAFAALVGATFGGVAGALRGLSLS